MFLLARPFVSDWLIKTLQKNQYPVIQTVEAVNLLEGNVDINWVDEKNAISSLESTSNITLYSNSENALEWLHENLPNHPSTRASELFKDKARFRVLLKELYPDYFFKVCNIAELSKLDPTSFTFPLIIKPSKGFFSIGVHKIHTLDEWNEVIHSLNLNTEENIYPESVLDTQTMLIESYIEGKEFAIDCYYNQNGKVIVTNILYHKFATSSDHSDRLYITSEAIVKEHVEPIQKLLQKIGDRLGLKNYPLHIEVRKTNNGTFIPIEVNPLRYGGWCTTADLSYFGHGFNAYEYVMEQKTPNWDQIFAHRKEEYQCVIVLNNNTGLTRQQIDSFDYEKLKNDFHQIECLRNLDIQKWPLFGFIFTRTPFSKRIELENILHSNLLKYIFKFE